MKGLRELRLKLGLSQADLEKLTGIDANNFSRYERGIVVPSVEAAHKIAQVLGVTVDELINGPANQEFEVKIVMGVKNVSALAGIALASNSFTYGVNDTEPSIVLMGNVRIDTPEDRQKAREEILRKFDAACWMFDHRDEAGA